MFIVTSYPVAIAFCIITMFCWGYCGPTLQKLAAKKLAVRMCLHGIYADR